MGADLVVEIGVIADERGVLFQGGRLGEIRFPAYGTVPALYFALGGRFSDLPHNVLDIPALAELVEARVASVVGAPLCAVVRKDHLGNPKLLEAIAQNANDVLGGCMDGRFRREYVARFVVYHGKVLDFLPSVLVRSQFDVVYLPHVVDIGHLEALVNLAQTHRDILESVFPQDRMDRLGGGFHPRDYCYLGCAKMWIFPLGAEGLFSDRILDRGMFSLLWPPGIAFHQILHAFLFDVPGMGNAVTLEMAGVQSLVADVPDVRVRITELFAEKSQSGPIAVAFSVLIDKTLEDAMPFGLDLLLSFKSLFVVVLPGLVHSSQTWNEPLPDKSARARESFPRAVYRARTLFSRTLPSFDIWKLILYLKHWKTA